MSNSTILAVGLGAVAVGGLVWVVTKHSAAGAAAQQRAADSAAAARAAAAAKTGGGSVAEALIQLGGHAIDAAAGYLGGKYSPNPPVSGATGATAQRDYSAAVMV